MPQPNLVLSSDPLSAYPMELDQVDSDMILVPATTRSLNSVTTAMTTSKSPVGELRPQHAPQVQGE